MYNKFRLEGIVLKFPLCAFVRMNGERDSIVRKTYMKKSEHELNWLSHGSKHITPGLGSAIISTVNSVALFSDNAMCRNAINHFSGLSVKQSMGIDAMSCCEAVTILPDLRNLILKIYLMCCDFAINVSSGTLETTIKGRMEHVVDKRGCSDTIQLEAVVRDSVVVNADFLTEMELDVLCLALGAYPNVKFGVENMNNSIELKSDNLVLVGDQRRGSRNLTLQLLKLCIMLWFH